VIRSPEALCSSGNSLGGQIRVVMHRFFAHATTCLSPTDSTDYIMSTKHIPWSIKNTGHTPMGIYQPAPPRRITQEHISVSSYQHNAWFLDVSFTGHYCRLPSQAILNKFESGLISGFLEYLWHALTLLQHFSTICGSRLRSEYLPRLT
jgi:hypothetical protein